MYIWKNDLKFLMRKYKIVMIFLLINFLSLIINLNLDINSFDKITISTGTNIMKNNFSIIQYIILIFNNLFFVLISLELFIKDFNYELDNIFTRMKITKWGLRKNLTIILFTIFLKVIQYLLMIIY